MLDWLLVQTPVGETLNPSPRKGTLYLVATPIGNLEDITVRALRILGEVSLIACEDTRHTAKLLSHYNIHKPTVSYHEHNEDTRSLELLKHLEEGRQIALVTDAGTPLISDPGFRIVSLCLEHKIPVIPIPGPSALMAALSASGLPSHGFSFIGFLPAKPAARRKALEALAAEPRTIALYEAPHRLVATLSDALKTLGRRHAIIAREITKIHEEFLRGDLAELLVRVQHTQIRGEITILIAPASDHEEPANEFPVTALRDRVEQIMRERAIDRKAALKLAARERGLTRREAYKELLSSGE